MKKSLLLSGLLLISSVANASGLYVSLGYSNADPEFEQRGYALDSTDSFYDNLGFNLSDKWPSSTSYPRYEDWAASSNLKQEVSAEYNNGKKYSVALGYNFSKTPFSLEFEYQSMKADISKLNLTIHNPDGKLYTSANPTYDDVKTYDFSFNPTDPSNSFDITDKFEIYMGNIKFEIPGFGALDPYVGYGWGKAKIKENFEGTIDNYDASAKQILAGAEIRFGNSPWVVGAEWKKLTLKQKDSQLVDTWNKLGAEWKDSSVMFKVKYDFPPTEFLGKF